MSEISPVPHTGQCEGEIWASSQAAEQGKLGARKGRSYLGPAETEQIKEGAKLWAPQGCRGHVLVASQVQGGHLAPWLDDMWALISGWADTIGIFSRSLPFTLQCVKADLCLITDLLCNTFSGFNPLAA